MIIGSGKVPYGAFIMLPVMRIAHDKLRGFDVVMACVKKIIRLFSITALISFVMACSETPSDELKSAGIHLDVEATSPVATQIDVKATFKTSSGDYVNLVGNDYADASVGGITRMLTKEESLIGEIHYETTFNDLFETSDAEVVVTLHRDDEPSYANSMRMPNSFLVGSPSEGESFTLLSTNTLSVSWYPTSIDDMSIERSMTCSDGFNSYEAEDVDYLVGDPGVHSVNVEDMLTKATTSAYDPNDPNYVEPNMSAMTCGLTLVVVRSRATNDVHSSLNGGKLLTAQRRRVRVNLVP